MTMITTNAVPTAALALTPVESDSVATSPDVMPKRGAPVTVAGTWDGARKWLAYAGQFERAKLYSLVMLGFELIELRRQNPAQPGRRTDLPDHSANAAKTATSGQVGQGFPLHNTWEETVEEELSIPARSAFRYMEMARLAAPRLRQTAGLGTIDMANTCIASLPADTKKVLADVVRKISDGKTQQEFCADLGIYKGLGGKTAGRKKGDGGRPPAPTDPAAIRRLRLSQFREALGKCYSALADLKTGFLLAEDQDQVACEGLIAMLDNQSSAMKTWFNTPALKRDAALAKRLADRFKP